jgi:hypothetical protein
MSNDPLQPPPPPLPHPGEPGYPAPGHDPYTPVFGESSDPKKAKGRLLVPGVLIVLIGILNLVPGIGCTSIGLIMNSFSDAQMEQLVKQGNPEQWPELQRQGYDGQAFKNIYLYSGLSVGGLSVFLCLVTLVGGGCMIAGRGYLFCALGALGALLSPGGCGLLGFAIGIWALVVLFSEDVRHAFRKPETSNLAGGGYPR